MLHGNIPANTDVHGKTIRAGSVTLLITDLTKAVSFASAMPTSTYAVTFARSGAVATVIYASAKTTAGFTLNLSAGIAETVEYIAVEY